MVPSDSVILSFNYSPAQQSPNFSCKWQVEQTLKEKQLDKAGHFSLLWGQGFPWASMRLT